MSTLPTATHRPTREPRHALAPGAGDVVLAGAVLNFCYSAVIIHALANPGGRFGVVVAAWVQHARVILAPAYMLAGRAGCGGAEISPFVARAWAFDVHLIAVNLIVATVLFAASRPYWTARSQQLHGDSDLHIGDDSQWGAGASFGAVLCGAVAALWWLILENDLFDSAAHCRSLQPWLLYREPLLTTFAHGCATFAAALSARKP